VSAIGVRLAMSLGAVVAAAGAVIAMVGGHDAGPTTTAMQGTRPFGAAALAPADPPNPTPFRITIPGLMADKPAPTPTPPPSPASAEGLRIWAYGDSTSWFVTQEFARLLVLEGAIDTRVVTNASADEVSRRGVGLTGGPLDLPAYVAAETAAHDPDVVVLMFGANDAVGGVDADSFQAQVAALMDQLQRPGQIVLWVGEPAMTRPDLVPHIAVLNGLYAAEAAKRDWVRFVDAHAITVGRPLAADGVHPSASSGALIAEEAIRVLFGR
jgi:hypothetical protein